MLKKLLTIIALAASSVCFGQSISAGYEHSLFLCPNGTVKACGGVEYSQLGLAGLTNRLLPESIPNLSNIISVAAGYNHSLFLKNDGTVWGCGKNLTGVLGMGNLKIQPTVVQIAGLTGIIAISTGERHSLFLKNDGTVWASGFNQFGALGIGNTTDQLTPVPVGGLSGIIAIAAGTGGGGVDHSLFLKNDGTVWACGRNTYGQLGQGNTTNQLTPVQINGLSGIIAISTGAMNSFFLKNDGTVWACGWNTEGQLGIGNTIDQKTPVQITSLSGITAVAPGTYHSLFLKNDSTVWACGNNKDGALAIGNNTTRQKTPLPISSLNGITAIAARMHSLFLKNDGTVWACGWNIEGQLGNGNKTKQYFPTSIGTLCPAPSTPTVDYSSMPNTTCVGSTVNVDANISGSNPETTYSVDNSIQINNPKTITKNNNSVFVLNDNDAIARFDFNGTLISSYPNLGITGILAFAADDSSNVYLYNGDGHIYKCDSTGTLVNTQSSLWLSSGYPANQLVFTKPVYPSLHPENLFLIDAQQSSGGLLTGIDTYNNNQYSNSDIYSSDSTINSHATSMSIDDFYQGKRALLADPVNSTLRSRVLYPDGTNNFNYQEAYLVDPSLTAGMAFDFIDTHPLYNSYFVSSKTTRKLGIGIFYRIPYGPYVSAFDTSITSAINPVQPVGIVATNLGSSRQVWIADRGQNRILRAYPASYRISPALPPGLHYNGSTGKISGTPTQVTSPQTYQVILTTPYGTDTSYFTFAVTPTTAISNTPGTATSNATVEDNLRVVFFDPYTCSSLVEIKDSLGGTSPGQTQVTQTVSSSASVSVGNKNFVRRVTSVTSEVNDSIYAGIKLSFTYDDIEQYNQAYPSNKICDLQGTHCNDTAFGSINIAVLQLHEYFNDTSGAWKNEPILHSPLIATWDAAAHVWNTGIELNKLSEFYAGPTSVATGFDCSNAGADTIIANDYYVWNYDTLYASGDYRDTLVNQTGCDSIASLNLTIDFTTGLNEAAMTSGITVYPNPSTGIFNVHFNNAIVTPTNLRVINIIGQQMLNKTISTNDFIDLSSYQNGIYYLIMESEGQSKTWRVVKQN